MILGANVSCQKHTIDGNGAYEVSKPFSIVYSVTALRIWSNLRARAVTLVG